MPNPMGPSRIIQVKDAPLPTPSPWDSDPPGVYRCPRCALASPAERRCERCGLTLVVKTVRRRPLTANFANLLVVLIGRGPLLLAIGMLYRPSDAPLINPWTIWLILQLPLFWLCAGGLFLRWRAAWYGAFALSLIDLVAEIALQLIMRGNPLLPIAAILADLMVMGFLLTVFDEIRVEWKRIAFPADHALPPAATGAYNAGVAYSKGQLWYFAARMWQRAVALQHVEPRYRRALGLAYLRLHEPAAAASELRATLWLDPDDAQARELLGLSEGKR